MMRSGGTFAGIRYDMPGRSQRKQGEHTRSLMAENASRAWLRRGWQT
ncbi:MAG: hypothetical protein WBZ29_03920 [Methanocella sp.]